MADWTLYDIRLEIDYLYEAPAGASRSVLRIQPRTTSEQQMITGLVTTEPVPSYRQEGRDFFGNAVTEVSHDGSLSEIAFRFTGRVRRAAGEPALDLSCALDHLPAELAALTSIAPDAPHHFLGESPRVRTAKEIGDFARAALPSGASVLGAVDAVARAIHGEIAFDPTATDVSTDPTTAFRNRRGVCQDMSHIMIAGLRALGIPAGYVSGYLRTIPPPGQPRLEGADAMHAWVRAWCGQEMGWIEIDPTNAILAGEGHIAVAVGRDYSDVAPVKGSLRTIGRHETTHRVDVVPVE
ncbi:transglutaminase family protein [Rhodobacterales bacterium HKCCE3408]|nr:transglutaminase family protein [Rhodobacterales bacterium HKCCE3408]